MDIREALVSQQSKAVSLEIAAIVKEDTEKFADLMEIFFADNYRLTQRTAAVLMVVVETKPQLITPYLTKMVAQLKRRGIQDAIKRNIVRLFQFIELPENLKGRVFSDCVDLVDSLNEAPAIRAFALTVAGKVGRHEPDLIRELCQVAQKHFPYTSPAFRKRAREIFNYAEKKRILSFR
jgi:hypothetical protein